MPIGVKGAEVFVGFGVEEIVEFDLFMPDLRLPRSGSWNFNLGRITSLDTQAEDLLSDLIHAADDTVDWEVGAKGFLVEGVTGLTLLLCPVADFPWLQERGMVDG